MTSHRKACRTGGMCAREQQREQPRRIHHLKLRVMNAPAIAAFYRDLFELKEEEKALEDPNFYLTDGKMTLIIAPWKISDFEGAGIDRPGIEHIGFKVESVEAVKKDLAALREADPGDARTHHRRAQRRRTTHRADRGLPLLQACDVEPGWGVCRYFGVIKQIL